MRTHVIIQRFNDGKAYSLRRQSAAGLNQAASEQRSDTLAETDSHVVVKAGTVPATVGAQASTSETCSGKVLAHG